MKKAIFIFLMLFFSSASLANTWVCTDDPNVNPGSCQLESYVCGTPYNNAINPYTNVVHIQEVFPQGTGAGVAYSGIWYTRNLNTVITNDLGAELSNGNITLPSGTYWVKFGAPATYVHGYVTNLFNVTTNSVAIHGKPAINYAISQHSSNTYTNVPSEGEGKLVLTEDSTLRLETKVVTSRPAPDGLGAPINLGQERYAEVIFMKIE